HLLFFCIRSIESTPSIRFVRSFVRSFQGCQLLLVHRPVVSELSYTDLSAVHNLHFLLVDYYHCHFCLSLSPSLSLSNTFSHTSRIPSSSSSNSIVGIVIFVG